MGVNTSGIPAGFGLPCMDLVWVPTAALPPLDGQGARRPAPSPLPLSVPHKARDPKACAGLFWGWTSPLLIAHSPGPSLVLPRSTASCMYDHTPPASQPPGAPGKSGAQAMSGPLRAGWGLGLARPAAGARAPGGRGGLAWSGTCISRAGLSWPALDCVSGCPGTAHPHDCSFLFPIPCFCSALHPSSWVHPF